MFNYIAKLEFVLLAIMLIQIYTLAQTQPENLYLYSNLLIPLFTYHD